MECGFVITACSWFEYALSTLFESTAVALLAVDNQPHVSIMWALREGFGERWSELEITYVRRRIALDRSHPIFGFA